MFHELEQGIIPVSEEAFLPVAETGHRTSQTGILQGADIGRPGLDGAFLGDARALEGGDVEVVWEVQAPGGVVGDAPVDGRGTAAVLAFLAGAAEDAGDDLDGADGVVVCGDGVGDLGGVGVCVDDTDGGDGG